MNLGIGGEALKDIKSGFYQQTRDQNKIDGVEENATLTRSMVRHEEVLVGDDNDACHELRTWPCEHKDLVA